MTPPGVAVVPLRTPTLAPATHTNTWLLGDGAITVVDPASPWEDEQRRLEQTLRERIAAGERVERIVLTHHHADHVGGAMALRAALGDDVPILAHAETARRVAERIRVDEELNGGQVLTCGEQSWEVLFTPGHAPGHVALYESRSGAVVAGDLVAGVGTILIDPRDGDLETYLASLGAVRDRAPTVLLPAHGPAMPQAEAVLAFYVAHRHQRTAQIQRALDEHGGSTAFELAPRVYPDLPPETHPVAAIQITAHLLYLRRFGLAHADGERWFAAH